MPNKKLTEFTDYEMHVEFPSKRVADHEVYIAFNGDDQAEDFRVWLAFRGMKLFQQWINEGKPYAQ